MKILAHIFLGTYAIVFSNVLFLSIAMLDERGMYIFKLMGYYQRLIQRGLIFISVK